MSPSWQDIEVPTYIVEHIKSSNDLLFLDRLLNIFVFKTAPKIKFTYECLNCGKTYRPERNSEMLHGCHHCGFLHVICHRVCPNGDRYIYLESNFSYNKISNIIKTMAVNYINFYDKNPGCIIDCGFNQDDNNKYSTYSEFKEGEKICGVSPRINLIKSAILCPYLWKDKFKKEIVHIMWGIANEYRDRI